MQDSDAFTDRVSLPPRVFGRYRFRANARIWLILQSPFSTVYLSVPLATMPTKGVPPGDGEPVNLLAFGPPIDSGSQLLLINTLAIRWRRNPRSFWPSHPRRDHETNPTR